MYCEKQFSSFAGSSEYDAQALDPSSYMSFTECLQGTMDYNSLATSFGLSPTSSGVFSSAEGDRKPVEAGDLGSGGGCGGGSETLGTTQNSSISSSSSEAGAEEEDSGKSKKDSKAKGDEGAGESAKKG